MKKCSYCGAENSDDEKYCTQCGHPLPEQSDDNVEVFDDIADNVKSAANKIGNHVNDHFVVDAGKSEDIKFSEDEIQVKKYLCSKMNSRSDGYLIVTNKRIMYSAAGDKSRIQMEVKLADVSGLHMYYGLNLSVLMIIIGIILLIVALKMFGDEVSPGISFILLLLAVFLFWQSYRKTYTLLIYSSGANGAPINLGEGVKSVAGNSAAMSVKLEPGPDTTKMMSELGAMIMDLQLQGDRAITKWKE